jgi:ribosomal protein S14
MNDFLAIDLNTKTTVELRKIAALQGIKGMSSSRKADLLAILGGRQERLIDEAHAEALAEDAARTPKPVSRKRASSKCTECGRPEDFRASELCKECREYGEWENEHQDNRHAEIVAALEAGLDASVLSPEGAVELAGCQVCHPELDRRKAPLGSKTGRSRAGMVIVAKGSEIHKSQTFKAAAEAAGWTVTILGSVNIAEDGEEQERYVARATKGSDVIELAWNGRAYDYPSSSAVINGRSRKVRNLKEALRVL